MTLLDKILEKKDLVNYIVFRIKRLQNHLVDIKKYPEKNRSRINTRHHARIRELKRLKHLLSQNKMRSASKEDWKEVQKFDEENTETIGDSK